MVDDRRLEISGAECVLALILAGFRVTRRAPGSTLLARGSRLVIVPDALVLPSAVLDAILSDADLSHVAFLGLLAEEPTLPETPVRSGELRAKEG